jgi:hypothetical protein
LHIVAHVRQSLIDLHPKHAAQCVGGDALRTQYQDQADMKASKDPNPGTGWYGTFENTQCEDQPSILKS